MDGHNKWKFDWIYCGSNNFNFYRRRIAMTAMFSMSSRQSYSQTIIFPLIPTCYDFAFNIELPSFQQNTTRRLRYTYHALCILLYYINLSLKLKIRKGTYIYYTEYHKRYYCCCRTPLPKHWKSRRPQSTYSRRCETFAIQIQSGHALFSQHVVAAKCLTLAG